MSGTHEQRSEVARLLAQINEEYEAAQRGLSGLAEGISRHQFTTKRMERIGEFHSQLRSILGDEAMTLIAAQQDHRLMPKFDTAGEPLIQARLEWETVLTSCLMRGFASSIKFGES